MEKRNVNTLLDLFGKIGGLNDLVRSIFTILIGYTSAKAYRINQLQEFYRESKD